MFWPCHSCSLSCRHGKRKAIKDVPRSVDETYCTACCVCGTTFVGQKAIKEPSEEKVPEGFQRGENGELLLLDDGESDLDVKNFGRMLVAMQVSCVTVATEDLRKQ